MALRALTPPLNAIRAFEAAARLGSMTLAGQEFSVTPGAVSQQVANLERILGIALFERQGGRLNLSAAGAAYLPSLSVALDSLEAATLDLVTHGGDQSRLVIGALHTFAATWLIPRLPDFGRRYPSIRPVVETLALNFASAEREPDVSGRRIDVGFYFGDGKWPGMTTLKLFDETQVVVARAGLVPAELKMNPRRLLATYPRLVHTTRPRAWDQWSAVTKIPLPRLAGPGFEHLFMVIEAAKHDLGIALLPRQLIEAALREDELEIVAPSSIASDGSYFLFFPQLRQHEPSIGAFRDWVSTLVPPENI